MLTWEPDDKLVHDLHFLIIRQACNCFALVVLQKFEHLEYSRLLHWIFDRVTFSD